MLTIQFYEEHYTELALHKAAKAIFDELGTKKLPTVKVLQAEYTELLAKKNNAYTQYRTVKK